MAKYGRGLNREIVGAVNIGLISEPFCVNSIKYFVKSKGWNIPDTYINVCLANGSSENHSHTYKKYFISVGSGQYKISQRFAGSKWG